MTVFLRPALAWLIGILVVIAALVPAMGGIHLRAPVPTSSEITGMIEAAEPIISAVRHYERDNRHPPATLAQLTPRYLPRIPSLSTGGSVGHDYLYAIDPKVYPSDPTKWRLAIPLHGEPNAILTYSSQEDYAPGKIRHPTERIGKWAYYHGNPY